MLYTHSHIHTVPHSHTRSHTRSVSLYTRNKVELLLPHVSSTKIYSQYAKAREAEKHYQKAAKAYEQAKDYDNATR